MEIEDRIRYLQSVVPPDDIYTFAQYMIEAAAMTMTIVTTFTNPADYPLCAPIMTKILKNLTLFGVAMESGNPKMVNVEDWSFHNMESPIE